VRVCHTCVSSRAPPSSLDLLPGAWIPNGPHVAVPHAGTPVSVATIFSALSLIQTLRESVGKNWTFAIENAPETLASISRLTHFLTLPNRPLAAPDPARPASSPVLIELRQAAFRWSALTSVANTRPSDHPMKPTTPAQREGLAAGPEGWESGSASCLRGLNCAVGPGQLLLVAGRTGAGK
jgi:hypothetical protein